MLLWTSFFNRAAGSSGGGLFPTRKQTWWHAQSYGDRTGTITATTTATLGGGTFPAIINGVVANVLWWNNGQSTREMKFDFGSAVIMDAFRFAQNTTSTHGTWVVEGSSDNSSWSSASSSFTLGGAIMQVLEISNTTAYRYYRFRQTAGTTSSSPYIWEMEFRLGNAADADRYTIEHGDRTALISATSLNAITGTASNAVDGAYAEDTTDGFRFGTGTSSNALTFDFGVACKVDGVCWLKDTTADFGTWCIEGSNDNSSYTQCGSDFTTADPFIRQTNSNTTLYRYYRLRQKTGSIPAGTITNKEIEFRATV